MSTVYTINNNSYTFKLIQNDEELFDTDIISATYIIHLEGNGRIDHIKQQINKFKTSKKIFILHNKGYKKSQKQAYINTTCTDLIDANLTIFKHAHNNNFKNILVFEDDFICDTKLLDKNITNEISDFIDKNQTNSIVYYLGTVPLIIYNSNSNHINVLKCLSVHAVIYTSMFMKFALNFNQSKIKDWDLFLATSIFNNSKKYMYKECLCYQTFEVTDNQNNWGKYIFKNDILNKISRKATECCIFLLNFLEMDKKANIDKKFKIFYDNCIKIK